MEWNILNCSGVLGQKPAVLVLSFQSLFVSFQKLLGKPGLNQISITLLSGVVTLLPRLLEMMLQRCMSDTEMSSIVTVTDELP